MKNKMSVKHIGLSAGATVLISNTLFGSIEPRIRSAVAVAGGFLLIVFSQGGAIPISIGLGIAIGGLADTANTSLGGTIIKNKFNGTIWYKSENSDKVFSLKPYETIGVIKKIDGLATPFKPNHVYKIPNGCVVTIKENGDVELTSISKVVVSKLEQKAGWRDKSFIDEYPDWKILYEKSII